MASVYLAGKSNEGPPIAIDVWRVEDCCSVCRCRDYVCDNPVCDMVCVINIICKDNMRVVLACAGNVCHEKF